MKKLVKMAIISTMLVVLGCACANHKSEESTDAAKTNTADTEDTINLGEIIQQMKEEQSSPTPDPEPSPSEEPVEKIGRAHV